MLTLAQLTTHIHKVCNTIIINPHFTDEESEDGKESKKYPHGTLGQWFVRFQMH